MTRAIHGFGFALKRKKVVSTELNIKNQFAIGLLIVLILSSAFSVVYLKDLSRRLFIQYQTIQRIQQVQSVKQNKLMLEKDAWSTQARIQSVASSQLGMVMPSMKHIVILRG